MRTSDIRDSGLRNWAEKHVSDSLDECRAQKASSEELRDIWKSYAEADWGALREVIPLRHRCRELGIERTEQEIALQHRIRGGPYSIGAEVAALRTLLEDRRGAFTETVALDMGDFSGRVAERFRPR